jgi:CRP-like cAMP-binding protein
LISEVKIFHYLDDDEQQSIVQNVSLFEFNDGDEIVKQGEDGSDFFVIEDGKKMKFLFLYK